MRKTECRRAAGGLSPARFLVQRLFRPPVFRCSACFARKARRAAPVLARSPARQDGLRGKTEKWTAKNLVPASSSLPYEVFFSGSNGARTHDLSRVRRTLIPAELCFRTNGIIALLKKDCKRKFTEFSEVKWRQRDSNPRPLRCERNALPAELCPLYPISIALNEKNASEIVNNYGFFPKIWEIRRALAGGDPSVKAQTSGQWPLPGRPRSSFRSGGSAPAGSPQVSG